MRVAVCLYTIVILSCPASAEDLASPSGEAWWKRLAECGGVTLAARDAAQEAKQAPTDIAALTRRMNGFLEAAWKRLAKDRGSEESPAKRTVYRTAGSRWQAVKSAGDESGLPALAETCSADLAAFEKLKP